MYWQSGPNSDFNSHQCRVPIHRSFIAMNGAPQTSPPPQKPVPRSSQFYRDERDTGNPPSGKDKLIADS
jgi:hypothetical protein